MNITIKRRITALSITALAVAPYSAVIGLHLIAKAQPQSCEDRRNIIVSAKEGASWGIVTTCRAWGFWEVSKRLRRDGEL
jgi:hypothetical protein